MWPYEGAVRIGGAMQTPFGAEACVSTPGSVLTRRGSVAHIDFDFYPVRIVKKQLRETDRGNFVDGELDAVRAQRGLDGFAVHAVEGDVIDRTRSRSPRGHADADLGRMSAIAVPRGDVDAGYLADVEPVAGECQRRTCADAHP